MNFSRIISGDVRLSGIILDWSKSVIHSLGALLMLSYYVQSCEFTWTPLPLSSVKIIYLSRSLTPGSRRFCSVLFQPQLHFLWRIKCRSYCTCVFNFIVLYDVKSYWQSTKCFAGFIVHCIDYNWRIKFYWTQHKSHSLASLFQGFVLWNDNVVLEEKQEVFSLTCWKLQQILVSFDPPLLPPPRNLYPEWLRLFILKPVKF